jgi:hypothetical protein
MPSRSVSQLSLSPVVSRALVCLSGTNGRVEHEEEEEEKEKKDSAAPPSHCLDSFPRNHLKRPPKAPRLKPPRSHTPVHIHITKYIPIYKHIYLLGTS